MRAEIELAVFGDQLDPCVSIEVFLGLDVGLFG